MNVIKNEKGTFIELPRESIAFCGSTEQEKKANELIFDLSLEIDRQQQEIERYKNIIDELEKWLNKNWSKPLAQIYVADVVEKINELKGSDE